jgi:hypothetical protein
MLMLYFGGLIFTEYLNEKKLVGTYLIGGLTGALFFIVSYNIFPVFSGMVSQAIAIGASASVLAVFFAIATYVPDYTAYLLLIGRIKLIYIALIFLVIDLLSINKGNPGGHLAHLGGALWGFVYILLLKRGYDFLNIFNTFRSIRNPFRLKKKSRFKIEYTRNGRPLTDDEYNEMRAKRQKLLDEILEKIAKNGYDCLSKEEKEFLFRKSSE